jgi:hypothetical protein
MPIGIHKFRIGRKTEITGAKKPIGGEDDQWIDNPTDQEEHVRFVVFRPGASNIMGDTTMSAGQNNNKMLVIISRVSFTGILFVEIDGCMKAAN